MAKEDPNDWVQIGYDEDGRPAFMRASAPKIIWKKIAKSGYVLNIEPTPSSVFFAAQVTIGTKAPQISKPRDGVPQSKSSRLALLETVNLATAAQIETIFAVRKSSDPADVLLSSTLLATLTLASVNGRRVKVVGEQMLLEIKTGQYVDAPLQRLVSSNPYPYIKDVQNL